MSHYFGGMGFFPRAPLVQMHMLINLFLIMMINNGIKINNLIMKKFVWLFTDKKFIC
jgi:hypothetical protein